MQFNQLKDVSCDLCGSDAAVEVPHCREYTGNQPVHICKNCGLVYFKRRKSPEFSAAFWEKEIFKKHMFTSDNPIFKSRHTYAVEFLKKYTGLNHKRIVDIGAGDGQFLRLCRNEGAKVFGIEPVKQNCRILDKLNIPYFNGTIEDYTDRISLGKQAKADIVTILWTLQNSQSCRRMLSAAYNMLNKNGHIFIQLGSRIMVPFKKPMGSYLSGLSQLNHPYHFSISTLQGVLAKCHFKITTTNKYWDEDLLCVFARKRPASEKIKWKKDNYKQVFGFFQRWHRESKLMKKYVRILPLKYALFKLHEFNLVFKKR